MPGNGKNSGRIESAAEQDDGFCFFRIGGQLYSGPSVTVRDSTAQGCCNPSQQGSNLIATEYLPDHLHCSWGPQCAASHSWFLLCSQLLLFSSQPAEVLRTLGRVPPARRRQPTLRTHHRQVALSRVRVPEAIHRAPALAVPGPVPVQDRAVAQAPAVAQVRVVAQVRDLDRVLAPDRAEGQPPRAALRRANSRFPQPATCGRRILIAMADRTL